MPAGAAEDAILGKLRARAPLIGDDCAVLPTRPGEDLLFTTDFCIERVHFTRDRPAGEVGQRALARSLSDIAAMGGAPLYCLISLALAPWTGEDWIDEFYAGLLRLADESGTQVAGGDLSHADQVAIDVMVCGSVPQGQALRRSGARPGDTLYVSGPLGGWTHKPAIAPRLALGRELLGRAHSCMDISDGLALDLHRLCRESGVSARLESVPLLPGATLEQAFYDGEDYELLYSASPSVQVPGIAIGMIAEGTPGALFWQGQPLKPKGYDHFDRS